METISVKQLSKSFEYYQKDVGLKSSFRNLFYRRKLIKEAVRDISFSIEEGEMVGFLGPNGAGKTTTLKMLSGILFPTSGEAYVSGFVPWERKKAFKMGFAIVMGQKSQLWWDLPANESFLLNRYIYELDQKVYEQTLEELSEMLDVKHLLKIQVRRLSLGERMKMELIASLLHKPRILFLDEPTIGLDILSQKKMRDFIKHYNEQTKTTVLLTSHYMNDIEDLCRRTIIINEGDLIYDGELSRVNDAFSGKKIVKIQLLEEVEEGTLQRFGVIREYTGLNATVEIDKNSLKQASRELLDTLPINDFTIEDIPIEEGIALLYKKGGESHAAQ